MNPPCRYDFNLPWRGAFIGALFYAGLCSFMVHLARDVSGIIFIGLITLSAMFAVLAVIMITRRLVFPRTLELTDDAILFPHGFPRTRITRILYADIIRMRYGALASSDSFCMMTARGSFEIGAARFSNIEHYRAVRDLVCAKTSILMTRPNKFAPSDWRIWGFPEPILRWNEPEEWPRYRTRLATSKPLLPRLGKAMWFFVRCFGIILLPWLLLSLFRVPTAPTAGYICLAAAVSIFITLIYHWLATIWPVHGTEISFRERGITQFFGKQTMDLNYADCFGWTVAERQFEGRILHILLLQSRTWRGRTHVWEFALPDTNIRDRLMQIFHDKQIPQSPALKPSWESGA